MSGAPVVVLLGHGGTWWSALIAFAIAVVPMLVCWGLTIRAEAPRRKLERKMRERGW